MREILFQKGRATEGDTVHKPRASSYILTCTWNIHNPTKSKTKTARVVAYATRLVEKDCCKFKTSLS